MTTAEKINSRFAELNADTDANAYSGLTAEDIGDGKVKIFDNYQSGEYNAEETLTALVAIEPINWSEYDNSAFTPIWDAISSALVYPPSPERIPSADMVPADD